MRYVRSRLFPTQRTLRLSNEDEAVLGEGLAALLSELPELRTRLYAANKDLYGDYDRKAAEATFKVNVGLAGIFLSFAASAMLNAWWTLLCIVMFLLIFRGIIADREAKTVLVEALVADQLQSPKFEALAARVNSGEHDISDPNPWRRTLLHMTGYAAVAAVSRWWWSIRRDSA